MLNISVCTIKRYNFFIYKSNHRTIIIPKEMSTKSSISNMVAVVCRHDGMLEVPPLEL